MTRAALAALLTLTTAPCLGQTPTANDAKVKAAIDSAAKYLISVVNADGHWDRGSPLPLDKLKDHNESSLGGYTALALNALACAGRQKEAVFKTALDWLMKQELTGTYAVALRLELIHRLRAADKYKAVLKRDTDWLLKGGRPAQYMMMWTYLPPPAKPSYGDDKRIGDLSCQNYALLGLWAASDERQELPEQVWQMMERTWVVAQHPAGGWSYFPPEWATPAEQSGQHFAQRGSLTAAGIASLYLVIDRTYSRTGQMGAYRKSAAFGSIQKGLKWLEENFSASGNPGGAPWFATYYFYNCERVATLAGLKYFGTHDWFGEMAATLVSRQEGNGAIPVDTGDTWGGALTDTAFALLFLAKGSAPIIFNKLQHEGDWDNRLRELGAFTEWFSSESERPTNWQVVNLKAPAEELTDSRMLFIAGTKPLDFSDQEKAKLKRYVELGGLLVFHPDAPGKAFEDSARKLLGELWPELELAGVDLSEHALGSIQMAIKDKTVGLEHLSSPTRMLAVVLHGAPGAAWERREYTTSRAKFGIAANLHYYVNDRAQLQDMPTKLSYFAEDFRGSIRAEGEAATKPARSLLLGRIKYGPNAHRWDPEPLALERFSRLLKRHENMNVDLKTVSATELPASGAKLAHLCGVDGPNLSADEAAALAKFVKDGGTLIIDQAGGPRKGAGGFDEGIRQWAAASFGPEALKPMPANHPWLGGVDKYVYRNVAGLRRTKSAARLECVSLGERPAVIYSRYDLTCGLLGNPNPVAGGLEGESAYQLMAQVVSKASGK